MSGDDKFQERISVSSGLVIDEGLGQRVDIGGLETETIDLSKLNLGGSQDLNIMGAVDQIGPQGSGGLQLDTDLSKFSEGIRHMQAQQADEKVSELLKKAHGAIEREDFKGAVPFLDQAIKIAPLSGQVWFLKAFCFMNLENFEEALETLAQARRLITDRETVTLALFLQALCMRRITQKLAEKISELVSSGQLDKALALVEKELRRQPGNPALLYHRGGLLMLAGHLPEAESFVTQAITQVGAGNAKMLSDLLGAIRSRRHDHVLEVARKVLRRGNHAEAVKVLEQQREKLKGNQKYNSIYAYACDRMGGGFFSSYRRQARTLTEQNRQQTLQWLFKEEIQAAVKALEEKKFQYVPKALTPVTRQDPRCGLANFLLALSFFRDFQDAVESERQFDVDEELKRIMEALRWVQAAQIDRELTAACLQLRKQLENVARQFQQAQAARSQAKREAENVGECFRMFNRMMEFFKNNPISNRDELEVAKAMVSKIDGKIREARRIKLNSEASEALSKLEDAVKNVRRQLKS